MLYQAPVGGGFQFCPGLFIDGHRHFPAVAQLPIIWTLS
jgi:hypothetical protein